MANRFWVGDGGDWFDTTYWSATSGGSGGESYPQSADRAIFDANSFTTTGQTVTFNSGNPAPFSVDFTDVTNSPTVDAYFVIMGDYAKLSASMTFSGRIYCRPDVNSTTSVLTAGQFVDLVDIEGSDYDNPVTLELLDSLDCRALQIFYRAKFYSNGYGITASELVDLQGTQYANLSTSEIHTADFQATSSNSPYTALDLIYSGDLYAKGIFMYHPTVAYVYEIGNLFWGLPAGATVAIQANLKCTDLTMYANNTYGFNDNYDGNFDYKASSIEFTNLYQDASSGNPITVIKNGGMTYSGNFIKLSGTASVEWWVISYNDATGGAEFYAGSNSTDSGNNTGWIFSGLRYWVGGTGEWDGFDDTHWSTTSGGAGGASVPYINDIVRFDANSFSATSQGVTITATGEILGLDFTGTLYTPTIYGAPTISVKGGDIKFISGLTFDEPATLVMYTLGGTGSLFVSLTTGGHTFVSVSFIGGYDLADDGRYYLLDAVNVSGTFSVFLVSLITNDFDINCELFSAESYRTLDLGTSTITCQNATGTALEILAGNDYTTPEIGEITHSGAFVVIEGDVTIRNIFDPPVSIVEINNLEWGLANDGLTWVFLGDVKMNDLKLYPNTTYTFTIDGCSVEFNTLTGNGTAGELISIQGEDALSYFNFICASGVIAVDYYSITNSNASGGATFNAGVNSIDGGGNTGWIFAAGGYTMYFGTLPITKIFFGDVELATAYFGNLALQ